MQFLTFTSLTLMAMALLVDVGEGRAIPISDQEESAPAENSDNVQTYIDLRSELTNSLREQLASRFNINDPSFNKILEDVLRSIHRYSRPRYGRSVQVVDVSEKTEDESVDEIEFENSIKLVSNSQPSSAITRSVKQ